MAMDSLYVSISASASVSLSLCLSVAVFLSLARVPSLFPSVCVCVSLSVSPPPMDAGTPKFRDFISVVFSKSEISLGHTVSALAINLSCLAIWLLYNIT